LLNVLNFTNPTIKFGKRKLVYESLLLLHILFKFKTKKWCYTRYIYFADFKFHWCEIRCFHSHKDSCHCAAVQPKSFMVQSLCDTPSETRGTCTEGWKSDFLLF